MVLGREGGTDSRLFAFDSTGGFGRSAFVCRVNNNGWKCLLQARQLVCAT